MKSETIIDIVYREIDKMYVDLANEIGEIYKKNKSNPEKLSKLLSPKKEQWIGLTIAINIFKGDDEDKKLDLALNLLNRNKN